MLSYYSDYFSQLLIDTNNVIRIKEINFETKTIIDMINVYSITNKYKCFCEIKKISYSDKYIIKFIGKSENIKKLGLEISKEFIEFKKFINSIPETTCMY
jgi:hypothetical protein